MDRLAAFKFSDFYLSPSEFNLIFNFYDGQRNETNKKINTEMNVAHLKWCEIWYGKELWPCQQSPVLFPV